MPRGNTRSLVHLRSHASGPAVIWMRIVLLLPFILFTSAAPVSSAPLSHGLAHGTEETGPHDTHLPAVGTSPTAHEPDHEDLLTAEEHFHVDNVVIDAATEARLAAAMYPGYGLRPPGIADVVDPGIGGSWSDVLDWPVVAIHVSLLVNGQVLAFDSVNDTIPEEVTNHNSTRAILWNPVTNGITRVDANTGWNLFCSGHAHLPDGNLYVAGGNLNSNIDGLDKTHIFDFQTNQWTVASTMYAGRWYPTVTPLANGEMLITSGRNVRGSAWPYPEVRTTSGSLRGLSNVTQKVGFYPWMQTTPAGQVFMVGPEPMMRLLDTNGTGSWQDKGERDSINRNYGSYAMYDIGKFLVTGGGSSQATARTIDVNSTIPVINTTDSMAFGRRLHNLTILADGTVLATGGNSSGAQNVDLNAGVYAAELWNPATDQWTTLNSMQVTRQYHSTALLLPDGRVLSAGGGICGPCVEVGYLAKSAEVFSPPYLFMKDGSGQLAPRPVISSAPSSVAHNANFGVSMQGSDTIQKVGLVRLGSVTHSVNMEQRYIPLAFTQSASTLQVTAPATANIAPPGYYMLFTIDSSGVPSVSKMVQLVNQSTPPQGDLIFADGFEASNLQAWELRSTDGGDLATQTAAALVGSKGIRALIDDNNAIFVGDITTGGEKRYRARFHFDPNSTPMANNDTLDLFRGFVGTSPAVLVFQLRYASNAYQVRTGLINDGTTWRYSAWFTISDAPHSFELDWQAATAPGANNGTLTLWIDGVQRSWVQGVDNDTRQIDRVRLGAISSIDTGTRGTFYFDAFESRRLNYIGSAPGTVMAAVETPDPADLYAWTEEEMAQEDMQPSQAPGLFMPLITTNE